VPQVRDLAELADVLVVACPGGAATRHLVNAEVLAALGPRGWLVNIARGSIVDEQALVEALQKGTIAGAGLDVFQDEPNVPEALLAMDNVVLFPHLGSGTEETRAAMGKMMLDNLVGHFSGQGALTPVQAA
jgi:lactate dehydrogenase-like 2-hydroxyacid dehydrogenase